MTVKKTIVEIKKTGEEEEIQILNVVKDEVENTQKKIKRRERGKEKDEQATAVKIGDDFEKKSTDKKIRFYMDR